MTLTVEDDKAGNRLKLVTDKTVELLELEEANDFLIEVMNVVERIEEREIELDKLRRADEYGDAETMWYQ